MWPFSRMCTSTARLDGKIAVITGANTGIGKETARDFYRRGAKVILACRNVEKAKAAVEDIQNNPFPSNRNRQPQNKLGELEIYPLDLTNLKSIKECAKNLLTKESAIHLLVNNAGVMMCPQEKTEDGFELQLQSNHLGHFLLTLLLLPKMQASIPGCRIINVSSKMHYIGSIHFNDINLERSYTPLKAYAQSKLANVMFTRELARRLKEANIHGINVYSLHPGVVKTELSRHLERVLGMTVIFRYFIRPFSKSSVQGAQTTIHCSVDEKTANETGLYYDECRATTPQRGALNDEKNKKLWEQSCQLLHLEPEENLTAFLKTLSSQIS